MTYPVVTRRRAHEIIDALISAIDAGEDPLEVLSEGECNLDQRRGCEYDQNGVNAAAGDAREKHWAGKDNRNLSDASKDERIQLEAEMAESVHSALHDLSMRCLEDEDFWRFLILFPYRWYLLAREPELQPQDFGGEEKDIDEEGRERTIVKSFKDQLLFRTYLWGQAAYDRDEPGSGYERATKIPAGGSPSPTDIWRSHIIRPRIGYLGSIPHAFVDGVAPPHAASTGEVRELAKLITRMKNVVLLDLYPLSSAKALLAEQMEHAKALADQGKEDDG